MQYIIDNDVHFNEHLSLWINSKVKPIKIGIQQLMTPQYIV